LTGTRTPHDRAPASDRRRRFALPLAPLASFLHRIPANRRKTIVRAVLRQGRCSWVAANVKSNVVSVAVRPARARGLPGRPRSRSRAIARLAVAAAALLAEAAGATSFGPVVAPRTMGELVAQATIHLGKTADWVVVTPDAVWVGSTGPNAVHRIDPARNELVATVPLAGEPCAGLVTGFNSLWVPLCGSPSTLARIDLGSNALTATLKLGPPAAEGGIAASADSVWLVLDKDGALARIDPDSGGVRQVVRVPPGSYNPRYSGGQIWVTRADGSEITRVDAANGKVLSSIRTGPGPRFLAAGDGKVWTLNQGDGSLTRIDTRDDAATRSIALGTPGHGGDIALGGGMVWTTMPKIPLTAVDGATGVVKCQWVGAGGDSLAIGHGSIWLTDYDAGTIARIDLDDALARCSRGPAS
jgi:streptogramin lyase